MRWQLTVRAGPKVNKQSFAGLDEALSALEQRASEYAANSPAEALDAKIRRFEPAEQVLARLEVAGPERFVPSVRAGVDVHGDGSVEAYRGRVRRQAIEPRRRETAYDALRRAMEEEAPEGSSTAR